MQNPIVANYYKTGSKHLVIIEGLGPNKKPIAKQYCSGKREAREIAKKHNATPWNF